MRAGIKYTYSDIVDSMKANGWAGEPIDVIRMQDGQLTSIDNTRVLAARESGINLQVKVWEPNQELPESMLGRFKNPLTNEYATTWSEAVEARILRQPELFISDHFPYGNIEDPMISFNTNTDNIRLEN